MHKHRRGQTMQVKPFEAQTQYKRIVKVLDQYFIYSPILRGWIVYKVIAKPNQDLATYHLQPQEWRKKAQEGGGVIQVPVKECNLDPSDGCGAGNNFGTLEYITTCGLLSAAVGNKQASIYVCLLKKEDVRWTCVPERFAGKARTSRLTILRRLTSKELNKRLREERNHARRIK